MLLMDLFPSLNFFIVFAVQPNSFTFSIYHKISNIKNTYDMSSNPISNDVVNLVTINPISIY